MAKRNDYKPGGKKYNPNGLKKAFTTDGFDNMSAHLGLNQDNMLARSGYRPSNYITWNRPALDDMYRTSWVVARTVEVVAEDMIRGGIDLQTTMDEGDKSLLLRGYRKTGTPTRLGGAIKWGRLYGGAAAMLLIDGQDPATPLDISSIGVGQYKGLFVLDRHQLTPSQELVTDLGPMLGYPEYYRINAADARHVDIGQGVHHSRMLRFIGVDLPGPARVAEQHWGASVVERVYDRILALDSATHGTANLLYKSFLRVIGVENYREILAAGGQAEKALIRMFGFIRQMQSNEGITLLDKKDTFLTHGWSFAGIYDAMQSFNEQISGAIGVPLVRLLGQSSKGFSTGENDVRNYYDNVLTQMDDDLRPAHDKLFAVQSRNLWGRALPEDFNFDYRSLFVPTESDKAQIATADAQNAVGLHNAGILSKAQALAELKDASRITGRYSGISDKDIEAARQEEVAPALSDLSGFVPGAFGGHA